MRILHMDTGTGWRGGQQQVLWLMEGARDLRLDQLLLAPAGSPLAQRARQHGLEVAELASPILSWGNLRTVRLKARQFDLLHAHDSRAHTLAWASRPIGRSGGPPVVVSRRVGFPMGSFGHLKYQFPALFIAVSEHVRLRLMQGGVPLEKIRVVYDGVKLPPSLPNPEARAEFRRRHKVDDRAFVLGTLASFAPEKLLLEELELLKDLPSAAHFWLGAPAAEPDPSSAGVALLECARRQGLEQRFRIVPISGDASAFLSSLDLFLYLSQSEGLGSAILLAMAHNLPVIASNVGGIPEVVRHNQTGLLLSGDPKQELPGAIRFLMGSPGLRQRLAEAGRKFVLANATSDRMVARTVALYEELLEGSSRRRA